MLRPRPPQALAIILSCSIVPHNRFASSSSSFFRIIQTSIVRPQKRKIVEILKRGIRKFKGVRRGVAGPFAVAVGPLRHPHLRHKPAVGHPRACSDCGGALSISSARWVSFRPSSDWLGPSLPPIVKLAWAELGHNLGSAHGSGRLLCPRVHSGTRKGHRQKTLRLQTIPAINCGLSCATPLPPTMRRFPPGAPVRARRPGDCPPSPGFSDWQ